jgi:hypothetical protein
MADYISSPTSSSDDPSGAEVLLREGHAPVLRYLLARLDVPEEAGELKHRDSSALRRGSVDTAQASRLFVSQSDLSLLLK